MTTDAVTKDRPSDGGAGSNSVAGTCVPLTMGLRFREWTPESMCTGGNFYLL
jgi:hypothetical protein